MVFFSTVLSCSLFVESGVHPPLCSSSSTLGVYAESMVGLLISVAAVPFDGSTWFVGHYIWIVKVLLSTSPSSLQMCEKLCTYTRIQHSCHGCVHPPFCEGPQILGITLRWWWMVHFFVTKFLFPLGLDGASIPYEWSSRVKKVVGSFLIEVFLVRSYGWFYVVVWFLTALSLKCVGQSQMPIAHDSPMDIGLCIKYLQHVW